MPCHIMPCHFMPYHIVSILFHAAWSDATLLIRREDDDVSFDATYEEFKGVIGSSSGGSYWMGLDTMHALTSPCPASVRMQQLDASGTQHFTYYKRFFVNSPSDEYRASFQVESTDMPDEYAYKARCNALTSNWKGFSARDHNTYGTSSPNTAATEGAGWWWASSGGNSLTRHFSELQCSRVVFPNMVKVELLLLTRDAQVCYY